MEKRDCIVIGGGVIGLTTARELAIRGYSVSLFDKNKLANEASRAAGGILSSMRPWFENKVSSQLSNEAKAYYEKFSDELFEHTGINSEYFRCGLLMIGKSEIELTKKWAEKNNIAHSQSFNQLPEGMQTPDNAIFLPEIAQIRVPRLLQALKVSVEKLGVEIHENTAISDIKFNQNECTSLLAADERYIAKTYIFTAGAWSSKLLGQVKQELNIKPVHGQMLCVKFEQQKLPTMILDEAHYLIPRIDGHVLIGSTMEDFGFEKKTTSQAYDELMKWATTLWPGIKTANLVKHWSGLRPAPEGGEPYIGKLNEYENIFINSGHFRKGILQAPIAAKQVANSVSQYLA